MKRKKLKKDRGPQKCRKGTIAQECAFCLLFICCLPYLFTVNVSYIFG